MQSVFQILQLRLARKLQMSDASIFFHSIFVNSLADHDEIIHKVNLWLLQIPSNKDFKKFFSYVVTGGFNYLNAKMIPHFFNFEKFLI